MTPDPANPSTDSPLSAALDHVWNGNECGNCGEALTDDKYEYPERYPCAALAPQDWAGWWYAACGMVGHPAEAHWHPPYVETHPSAAHPESRPDPGEGPSVRCANCPHPVHAQGECPFLDYLATVDDPHAAHVDPCSHECRP